MLNTLFFLSLLANPIQDAALVNHDTAPHIQICIRNPKLDLIDRLYEIGAIKFGEFTLKSGKTSPIYFDFRITISYPDILQKIAICLNNLVDSSDYDLVCGVPIAAIPLATALSLNTSTPLILCRKEAKDHGTKKMVEGVYNTNDRVLVAEDVATTGSSILETVAHLENAGLVVQDVVVVLDRQQGASDNLAEKGYNLHSILNINEVLDHLEFTGKIDPFLADSIRDYISN